MGKCLSCQWAETELKMNHGVSKPLACTRFTNDKIHQFFEDAHIPA
jgi:hypothetical protein